MSSPKAYLHLLYLQCEQQPRYETEPIFAQNESGHGLLAVAAFLVKPSSQQPIGFRCTLFLPDFPPVISDVFSRKKEAEQDAAKKALIQLGKLEDDDLQPKILSTEEKLMALAERIEALFSDKLVMNNNLLKEHFKAAMRRQDERSGALPVAVLASDNKIGSLCKSLHGSSENDPVFAVAMVWGVAKSCSSVKCEKGFFIRRKEPFSSQFQTEFLGSENEGKNHSKFQAVYIPSQDNEVVESIDIELEPQDYYLDVLSTRLGLTDEAALMISRSITRAPHGTRIYSAIPDVLMEVSCLADPNCNGHRMIEFPGELMHPVIRNNRASDLLGFSVYGDAILANVGSSWRMEGNLCYDDVSLSCYYRLTLGRRPDGNYRLSRNAPLVAKMPSTFSGRSRWRGKLPFSLLIDFCQQHKLPDPVIYFSIRSSCGLPTVTKEKEIKDNASYKCRTKIVYQGEDLEFESERLYRSRNDAKNSAALQALLFFSLKSNKCVNDHKSDYRECSERDKVDTMAGIMKTKSHPNGIGFSNRIDKVHSESNMMIAVGSMVSISCVVSVVGHNERPSLESHEEFEFESGVGGILPELENRILGMQVDAYDQLFLPVPCVEGLFASGEGSMAALGGFTISSLPLLRYDIKLLRTLEPPEERMESALFSPPLSRQRNEFAIQKIKEIGARSLVDLGCGSGSLLDAAVEGGTELELIAGVDISQKSLIRAAKSLCGKLDVHEDHARSLKKIILYEGSLADIDQRLCNFDVATCIEVVEHMDPGPLSKAGENILGIYAPKLLILSTPNIEYNAILQKITSNSKVDSEDYKPSISANLEQITMNELDALTPDLSKRIPALDDVSASNISDDDPNMPTIKLRNDDHRFEWTRAEFAEWADSLALKFGYTVEYSGVGGSAEDPGYASQIAIFTRNHHSRAIGDNVEKSEHQGEVEKIGQHESSDSLVYTVVWKYDKEGIPLDTV